MRELARKLYDHILFMEQVTVKGLIYDLNLIDSKNMRQRVREILKEIGRESKPVYNSDTKKVARYWVKKKSPKGAES